MTTPTSFKRRLAINLAIVSIVLGLAVFAQPVQQSPATAPAGGRSQSSNSASMTTQAYSIANNGTASHDQTSTKIPSSTQNSAIQSTVTQTSESKTVAGSSSNITMTQSVSTGPQQSDSPTIATPPAANPSVPAPSDPGSTGGCANNYCVSPPNQPPVSSCGVCGGQPGLYSNPHVMCPMYCLE